MVSDECLIQRTLQGDRSGFNEIVIKYEKKTREFIKSLCKVYYRHSQPEDQEDMCQEALSIAYRDLSKLKDQTKFLSWLKGIARNVVREWVRRSGTVAKYSAGSIDEDEFTTESTDGRSFIEPASQSPDALDLILINERNEKVWEAVSKLPLKYKQVIWLFYVKGYYEKEIAEKLNIPVGTVKSRLHNAKKKLAKLLKPYFENN